jgi:restriction system protein
MEYLTEKFDNTAVGIKAKDTRTRQLAVQGYRIVSEQIEPGHVKGDEQCCGALICLPLIFAAGRTPGTILVTYGRETLYCTSCGAATVFGNAICGNCKADITGKTTADEASARAIAGRKQEAARKTAAINKEIQELGRILVDTLATDHCFDWRLLGTAFLVPEPQFAFVDELPPRPQVIQFLSKLPGLEELLPTVRVRRLNWEKAVERNEENRALALARHNQAREEWQRLRQTAEQDQNIQADTRRRQYLAKDFSTLIEYWTNVLARSEYPDKFPRSGVFDYFAGDQSLVITYQLPAITCLPQVGEVRYIEGRNALEEVPVSDVWLKHAYSELLVKIALRTVYELFQSDTADALATIVFNGTIRSMDRSIGQEVNLLVISIETRKAEFSAINLAQVDPKACFNRFRGVLSEDLTNPTPIVSVRSGSSNTPASGDTTTQLP